LSVKKKENKLASIKCLKYNFKEKLKGCIINLFHSDIDVIKEYKRYKLELEIIKDLNKKALLISKLWFIFRIKEIRNIDVTFKNKHTFCFEYLRKPHGKLPCNENLDKSIEEYAMNKFMKKCPKCSIITEKNNRCNHITCTKCGYQWCWLCNEEYNKNHFDGGKCKGFQFFQLKNQYEIRLVMDGKIKFNELSNSQRQFDYNIDDLNFNDDYIPNFGEIEPDRNEQNERIKQNIYNTFECGLK